MSVIDTNDNVSTHLANLKSRGVTAVGRYYSSSAWKRITKHEAADITRAGMNIFIVFENDGDPKLTRETGTYHAQIALTQAQGIGQPEGTAIYFALEHLPDGFKKKHVKAIKHYVAGIKEVLDGKFKVGLYSDGVVLDALLTAELCDYAWLSASRGFEGSKEFYDSNRWALAQDPHVDQDWDGLSVDVNEAKPEFGAFQVPSPALVAAVEAHAIPDDFASRAREIASAEWEFFGRQTYDIDGHRDHRGHTEGEPGWYQRVGLYWEEGTHTHGIDGRNHSWPWSAAFISWVMRKAGAGSRFRYSTQHSVYISQGIRDYINKRTAAGYWTERLSDSKPDIGDLVCWAREDGVDYDHQKNGNYAGHTDLVVDVDANRIWVIGGNVGDSVTRRPLRLDGSGYVAPIEQNGETLFAIMKNRIAASETA